MPPRRANHQGPYHEPNSISCKSSCHPRRSGAAGRRMRDGAPAPGMDYGYSTAGGPTDYYVQPDGYQSVGANCIFARVRHPAGRAILHYLTAAGAA